MGRTISLVLINNVRHAVAMSVLACLCWPGSLSHLTGASIKFADSSPSGEFCSVTRRGHRIK